MTRRLLPLLLAGFALAGLATAEPPPGFAPLPAWLPWPFFPPFWPPACWPFCPFWPRWPRREPDPVRPCWRCREEPDLPMPCFFRAPPWLCRPTASCCWSGTEDKNTRPSREKKG